MPGASVRCREGLTLQSAHRAGGHSDVFPMTWRFTDFQHLTSLGHCFVYKYFLTLLVTQLASGTCLTVILEECVLNHNVSFFFLFPRMKLILTFC